MGLTTVLTGLLGKTAKDVGLNKILELGNKLIPDKNGQLELEKTVLEINQKILENNKTLLEKVVPVTFPLCVWVLLGYALVNLYLGIKHGPGSMLPFPPIISQLSIIFVTGLVGKWSVKEFRKK